ncbi:hypothetical protein LO763_01815 [Glycomyces sp. A-F 0318]|uniref:hypothetical protein n=1 Tax=Glycomyces amatae TaxID=2881355 RepID=UPI001E2C7F99|nr:hypothetical protein [Glycomyces amatae]MCD0442363.1 hypothetical protein [Glycomyces amatae]
MKTRLLVALLFLAPGLLTGCTGDADPNDPATSESDDPTSPSPPPRQDFTDEAAQLLAWADACDVLDLAPVMELFPDLTHADTLAATGQDNGLGGLTNLCEETMLNSAGSARVEAGVTVFDDNVKAFDHYHDVTSSTQVAEADGGSSELVAPVEWQEGLVLTREIVTSGTEKRNIVTVLLLGDFYVVGLSVDVHPGDLYGSGCESTNAEHCPESAAQLAEYFADSGYLDLLHANIEATLAGH